MIRSFLIFICCRVIYWLRGGPKLSFETVDDYVYWGDSVLVEDYKDDESCERVECNSERKPTSVSREHAGKNAGGKPEAEGAASGGTSCVSVYQPNMEGDFEPNCT